MLRVDAQLPVRRVAVVRDGVRRLETFLRDGLLEVQVAPGTGAGNWVVRDLAGRPVMEGGLNGMVERLSLPVAQLPAGPYLFELQRNGTRHVGRFVRRN